MTVEKHVRYVEDVDTLAAAWYFVMNHVDEFEAPSIAIESFVRYDYSVTTTEPQISTTGYTASIHGTINA